MSGIFLNIVEKKLKKCILTLFYRMKRKLYHKENLGSQVVVKFLRCYVGSSVGVTSAVNSVVVILPHVIFSLISVLPVHIALLCA